MPIDPYSPCPGGLDKKVKFCCPDLVSELDRIQRMVEGEQPQACLDHIEHLEAKFPGRACLETTKALLQGQLGMVQQAQQTIEHMLESQPDNPVALAEAALLTAGAQGGREAIPLLQRALAASGRSLSPKVAEAFLALAETLAAEGHVLAARGHVLWLLRVIPDQQEATQLLLAIVRSPGLSPLFKIDWHLAPPPPDVSWHKEFETALRLALDGLWLEAATRFGALSERVVAAPELWRNLALVRAWLAEDQSAAAAFHRLATLAIPLDDAVEAEALALHLDSETPDDPVDELLLTYTITDFERVSGALSTNPLAMSQPVETHPEDDQPPPRASFWLLDRLVPADASGIAMDDMPVIIGQAALFGRQTDREARLEVTVLAPHRQQLESVLAQVAPEGLTLADEKVADQVPMLEHLLSVRWRPPDAMRSEDLRRLLDEHRRRAVLEKWPNMPMKLFGGRTPAAVASDHSQRIRLLAKILHLELALDAPEAGGLTNELRQQLGLPQAGPIEPADAQITALPPTRYARVVVEKLSDEELTNLYQHASITSIRPAILKLGEEIVRRPTLDATLDKAAVYGMLAALERDLHRAVERLEQARQAAQKAGRSCARWDLEAFSLRIQLGQPEQASELLEHLQARHGKEPGVRQALAQLLYQIGAIGPDGRAAMPAAAAEAGGIVVPGGAAPEAGGIWTPGGEAASGKKSALWVPGMD
jgi:tetratricopeptide (TPR) repeat protein